MATLVRWGGSAERTILWHHFPDIREKYREIRRFRSWTGRYQREISRTLSISTLQFPAMANRDFGARTGELVDGYQGNSVSVHFSHACFAA